MRLGIRTAAGRRRTVLPPAAPSYATMFHTPLSSGESGSGGRAFYIDTAGNNSNAGTSAAAAWQNWTAVTAYASSPGFLPGDRILFNRGQNHTTAAGYTTSFSGNSSNPITIGAYGTGTPPALLMNNYTLDGSTGRDSESTIYQSVLTIPSSGSYITIRDLLISSVSASDVFEAGVNSSGTQITIDNCEISQASNGVLFKRGSSAGSIVRNCHIHDGKMQKADAVNPDDDFGCYGICADNTSDITVTRCTFKNISKPSPDYGLDGNCLEIYASTADVSNIVFQNNYIENCLGISEFGGTSTRSVSNVVFDHNVICNVNGLLYFHVGGTAFALSAITSVKFTNNTVYCDQANSGLVVDTGFAFSSGTGTFLTVQNNIFSIANMDQFDATTGGATLAYAHSNNLYDIGPGVAVRSGFTNAANEYVGIPAFADIAGRDFRIGASSGAVGRATALAGYLTDYTGLDMTGRPNLDIGAVESEHSPIAATATATLTELPSKRVYQRIGASAPITLSGTYTNTPAAIQARVVNATDSAEVSRWMTVAASPTGGTWTGTLTAPQGGWHKIQVRAQSTPGTVATAANTFGVGDVWLLVGQSQQQMMSTDSSSPPAADDRTVYFDGTTTWASPGVLPSTNGNGAIRFMNLIRTNTGVPQAVIQASVPDTAITDWEAADPAYTSARDKLIAAGAVAGILWHQGGTGVTTISRATYKTELASLRARFAAAATVQRFGVYPLMYRTQAGNTDLQVQETRRAHYEHIAENPGTVNLGWDPTIPMLADGVHTTPAGSEQIAYQFAQALLSSLGVIATSNLGPTITGVTRSGTTLTLTVQHTSGTSLKINSGTQATGFQVFPRGSTHSDAAALAISSITLGTNTITIVLAADPGQAVDVYYQYGIFDATSPVFDNATMLGRTVGNPLQPLMSPVQSVFEASLMATNFDGTNASAGRVTFADSASFDMPDASWTLGFMVKVSNNAGTVGNYVFSTGAYQAANSMNILFWEASSGTTPNTLSAAFMGADNTPYNVNTPSVAALLDGTWRLWTFERVKGSGTTTFNIYQTPVGGTRSLVHTQVTQFLTTISPPGGASGVPTLGTRSLTPTDRYINGAMYMAFQMDGVLTATETQNLAAGQDLMTNLSKTPRWYVKLTGTGPTFTDLSGNGNTATVAGTVTQTTGPSF